MAVEKDTPHSWLYLAVTVLMMLTVQSFNGSSGVFVAILIEKFNETNSRAGWVTSLVFFLLFLCCPVVIHADQYFGFRWCMVISGFLYVLAFLITPFMPGLNFMYFTFSVPFGITLSFVAQLTIRTQKQYFQKFYAIALGVRFGSIALGSAAMSFIFPLLYDELGFRGALLVLLAFSPVFMIFAVVSRTHLNDTRNDFSSKEFFWAKLSIYQELFKDKSFVLCLAGTTIFFLTGFTPIIFMVRYAVTLGYPLSKAKWLLIARNIVTLPARLIIGHFGGIAFRRGKVRLLVQICYPTFGFASFLCSFTYSFPLLIVYMGLVGVIEAVFWVTLSLYVDEITAGYHSDEAYGLICFTSAFTCLIGPPVQGWLFDLTGDFRYVFYTVFVVSLFSGFLVIISSFVKVKKECSLIAKGRKKDVVSEGCELSENIENVYPKLVVNYETSL